MSVSRAIRGVRVKFRTAVEGLSAVSYRRTIYSPESSAFLTDSTVTLDGETLSTLYAVPSCPACETSDRGNSGSLNSAPRRVASASCHEPECGTKAYLM